MQQHDYAAACPKLAESFRLDAAGGTAFALALCDEAAGKTATAWAAFDQALSIARRDKRADREAAAQEKVRALEKRLVRVRIVVQGETPGLAVTRDGVEVGRAQWGTPVPVDPGSHTLEAHATGKNAWSGTFTTGAEGSTVDAVVPTLTDQAAAPPPAAAPAAPAPTTAPSAPAPSPAPAPPATAPAEAPGEGSSQRTWGLVVGGVGVAALAVGAGFGIEAMSTWNNVKSACPGNVCPTTAGQQTGRDAGRDADISTVLVGAGVVGLGVGAALYFLAPSAPAAPSAGWRVTPTVSTQSLGVSVGGAL